MLADIVRDVTYYIHWCDMVYISAAVASMSRYDTCPAQLSIYCAKAHVCYSCQCVVGLCFSHSLCGATLFHRQWN